jgi:HAE1 family hydrophobic/amphiphilic exporter-1
MWISNTSVKRPVFATMVIAALIVFGYLSIGNIPLNSMPQVDFPIVTVQSVLPGASPDTVELEVTDKIESAVNTIDGIDQVRSNSLEGVSLVVIEFDLKKDINVAVQDVRDKLAAIRRDLPEQMQESIVSKLDFGAMPVVSLVVYSNQESSTDSEAQIKRITELTKNSIQERLQTLSGVGSVTMVGGQEREIRIWLDADRMRGYNIPVDLVKIALQSENIEVPGGRIETGTKETVVKTHGKLESVEEFNDLVVSYYNGSPVRISDIGYAEDGMEDLRSISYMDGNRAVSLEVRSVSGGNVVAIADRVNEELEKVKSNLPEDIVIKVALDNSTFVRASINDVKNEMLMGGTLAIFTILFFLRNFRTAIIAAIVLPTAVIASMTFVSLFGFSLNMLTMLALTISIGMLIDDAVVVIENIYHKLEHGETDTKKAAIDAIKEIGTAVVTTSMVILGVFVPVALMTGIIGRFFLEFGLTVVFAVILSTFTSLTLTPMLCSRWLSPRGDKKHNFVHRGITKFLRGLDSGYRSVLGFAVKFRWITLLIAVGVFIFGMYLMSMIPGEFQPPMDEGRLKVAIEAPLGSNLQETQKWAFQVEEQVRELPGLQFTYFSIGGGAMGQVNRATMQVELINATKRNFSQVEAIEKVRGMLEGKFPNLKIAVGAFEEGGGGFSSYAINYSILGMNMDDLVQVANDIRAGMATLPGFVDLDISYQEGNPEYSIHIDRDKAADLGVSAGNIAMTVNSLVAGEDVTTFESEGERYDVRLRLLAENRNQSDDLAKIMVSSNRGQLVELANLITIEETTGPVQIDRRKRMREITVVANLTADLPLGPAMAAIDEIVAGVNIPAGVITEHSGMGEMMVESFESMGMSLMLAILIIYMVLASLFESYIHPLTIMMALPLSFSGAIGALLIGGQTLNILSMIAVIMLMGLVTKNAILLIDFTIKLRNQGMSRFDALLEAGPRRLRPILMTSISTICGSIPVAMALGENGAFRAPMGMAVIGGMITSTLLTLLVVPAMYTIMDDMAKIPGKLMFWRKKKVEKIA